MMLNTTETPLSADYHLPTWNVTSWGSYVHHCMAWLPHGVLGPKIASFITSHSGKLLEGSPERVHILLGKRSFFGISSKNVVPVEVVITVHRQTECVRGLTHLSIELKARGQVRDQDAYDARCGHLLGEFRASLMAMNLERRFGDRSPVYTEARVWPIKGFGDDPELSAPVHVECYNVADDGLAFWTDADFGENEVYLRYGDPSSNKFFSRLARVTHRTTTPSSRRLYGVRFLTGAGAGGARPVHYTCVG